MLRCCLLAALLLAPSFPSVAAPEPAAVAAPAAPKPRPLEDFAALPLIAGPVLSPDGTKIAARASIDGQQMLAVFPVDSRQGGIRAIPTGYRTDINWWRWVGNDWLAIGVGSSVPAPYRGDMYATRIVGAKADGTQAKGVGFNKAGQIGDDLLWVADDNSPRVLVSMQLRDYSGSHLWPAVVEADLSTGHVIRQVVEPERGIFDWYADGAGVVRMGIGSSEDGRETRLLYRERGSGGFHTLDRGKLGKDTLISPALFLAEPNKVVVYEDSSGFTTLREMDLATSTLGKVVAAHPGFDIASLVPDVASGAVLGARLIEDGARTQWLDPALAGVQAEIDKAVGHRKARILSMDRARRALIVRVDAPDEPGSYYFYDLATGQMSRFAFVNEAFGGQRGHPVRTIRFKARDGLEIPTVMTLPRGRAARNLPVIVMPHGGPFARDSEEWDWWAQFLADRGYAVLQPNFRGSSGYGSAFAKRGIGQWGLAMQDDLNDALAWAAKERIVDPKRACMIGGSYGGYAAMRAAQRDGQFYRCAVSFAGVSDLTRMTQYNRNFLGGGAMTRWLKEQAPDLRGVSPINFPDQVSIPLLVIHGKEDLRVPVAQSREFVERLGKAGKDVRYVEQPLGDHHLSRLEDRIQFLRETEAFLKQHNPAD